MTDETLPTGWSKIAIEKLATGRGLIDGPFGSNLMTKHYTATGPRVIRLQNIGDGKFLDERAHISDEHFQSLRKHDARPGDIVVAMLGEVLPRACLVPASLGPAVVKADCVRLRLNDIALPGFVVAALNSPQVRKDVTDLVHGVGRPRLGLTLFRTVEIPLAPKAEQGRLVEALDSYLSRLDGAVANLERVRRNLGRYRSSVLQTAVEGGLVTTEAELARAEGRSFDPASVLLKRILVERRKRSEANGKKGKYGEPVGPDPACLPELPEGWCWASVDQLAADESQSLCDGPFGSNLKSEHYTDAGPRVLRLQNIGDGTFVDVKTHVSQEHFDTLRRHQVFPGDLLVASLGEVLPRACRVPESLGPAIVKADCLRFKPNIRVADIGYLLAALNSPPVRAAVSERVHGIGRPRMGLGGFRETCIPLPPLAEQSRIAIESDRLLSIAEQIDGVVQGQLARRGRLRQAILKWAFEGKLVDQDPSDESASPVAGEHRRHGGTGRGGRNSRSVPAREATT